VLGRQHSRLVRVLGSLGLVVSLVVGSVGVAGAGLQPGGSFSDDNGNIHEGNIEAIAAQGITLGCNPPGNTLYCPGSSVTRGQMAAFLVRALKLPATSTDFFADDDASVFESNINRMAAAGITSGCNPPDNDQFCPNNNVTRGQMAAFLVRAFGYTDPGPGGKFIDTAGSIFESNINRLATAGITAGCNPPDNDRFCPNDLVKRDQMASFLARALNLPPIVPPPVPPPPPADACEGSNINIPVSECEALVALYNATNGYAWKSNTFWFNPAVSPCDWAGVVCTNTGQSQRNVKRLLRGSIEMTGPIPTEIGDLQFLEEIFFAINKLDGTLPAELGSLPLLRTLQVNTNAGLGGEIPVALYTGLQDTLTQFSIGDGNGCFTVPSSAPAGMVPWLNSVGPGWDSGCS
jgi:S-layer homology domain